MARNSPEFSTLRAQGRREVFENIGTGIFFAALYFV